MKCCELRLALAIVLDHTGQAPLCLQVLSHLVKVGYAFYQLRLMLLCSR